MIDWLRKWSVEFDFFLSLEYYFRGIFRVDEGRKDNGKIDEGEGEIRNEWSMVVIMYG